MKKIIEFFKNIFANKELTAEEEKELINKIILKIKEN